MGLDSGSSNDQDVRSDLHIVHACLRQGNEIEDFLRFPEAMGLFYGLKMKMTTTTYWLSSSIPLGAVSNFQHLPVNATLNSHHRSSYQLHHFSAKYLFILLCFTPEITYRTRNESIIFFFMAFSFHANYMEMHKLCHSSRLFFTWYELRCF